MFPSAADQDNEVGRQQCIDVGLYPGSEVGNFRDNDPNG
jgi:hypothetical protein